MVTNLVLIKMACFFNTIWKTFRLENLHFLGFCFKCKKFSTQFLNVCNNNRQWKINLFSILNRFVSHCPQMSISSNRKHAEDSKRFLRARIRPSLSPYNHPVPEPARTRIQTRRHSKLYWKSAIRYWPTSATIQFHLILRAGTKTLTL